MSGQGPTPVPGSTEPFWRTQLHDLDNHRSTPHLPTECDVLIIGAGFAGAALAHYIYEDNPSPPSVTILEAREACSGATGRNGTPFPELPVSFIFSFLHAKAMTDMLRDRHRWSSEAGRVL